MSEQAGRTVPDENENQEYDDAFAEFANGKADPEADDDHEVDSLDELDADAADEQDDGDGEVDDADADPKADADGENEQEQEDDPWATAPEALRAERERLQHSLDSEKGRQAALQRKAAQLEQELQRLQQSAGNSGGPTAQQLKDAARDPEKFAELKEEFPDIAAGIADVRDQLRAEFKQTLDSRLGGIEQTFAQQQQERIQAERQAQYARLDEKHPDWRDAVNSDQFNRWLETQPQVVQQAVNSPDAADAIYLLDQYKAATAQSAAASSNAGKQDRLRRAAAPVGQRRAAVKPPEVPNDFEAAFNHFAKQK